MTRNIFGWSLPPGCTHRMIEEQCEEGPCAVCSLGVEDCICPECPVCGDNGNPKCYDAGENGHGLKLNKAQVIQREKTYIEILKNRVAEEQYVLEELQASEQEEWEIDEVIDPWK